MKTTFKKIALAASVAVSSLAGCGDARQDLAGALPSDDNVSIRVPGSDAAGSQQAVQPLLGEASDFYIQTYRISRFLNGHVVGLLRTIRDITSQPATSSDGNVKTWGPHTPGGLEPLTYRLRVETVAPSTFAIVLAARPKASQDEAAFKTLLEGQIVGSGNEDGRAKGDLVLHFDAAGALNAAVVERGDIQVAFNALEEPRTVAVDFMQFSGEDAIRRDATYRYSEAQDHSGSFMFSVLANIHKQAEARPALEAIALHSRWLASGAGRGDVTVTGEEVAAQFSENGITRSNVQATECWAEDTKVVFQDTMPEQLREEIRPMQGDASQCAFATADFPEQL